MEGRAGGGKAVRLIRGLPEVKQEDVTDDVLRQMLVDGGEWWLNNQKADGSYNYKFGGDSGESGSLESDDLEGFSARPAFACQPASSSARPIAVAAALTCR